MCISCWMNNIEGWNEHGSAAKNGIGMLLPPTIRARHDTVDLWMVGAQVWQQHVESGFHLFDAQNLCIKTTINAQL